MDGSFRQPRQPRRANTARLLQKNYPRAGTTSLSGISKFRAKFAGAEADSTQTALSTGTGFFISAGYLLTSHHLIANGRRIGVRTQRNSPPNLSRPIRAMTSLCFALKPNPSAPSQRSAFGARPECVYTWLQPRRAGIKLKFTEKHQQPNRREG